MNIKIINSKLTNKKEILKEISEHAVKYGYAKNNKNILKELIAREKQGTTGFENGVAIPHARHLDIEKSAIIISRFKNTNWESLDGNPTNVAISILVSGDEKAGDNHMLLLSTTASLLMDKENIVKFKSGNVMEIKKLIKNEMNKKTVKSNDSEKVKYDVVAVTTCPTGVAHTNMAADSLEKYALENNIKIKVERQAAQGRVNALTSEEIKNAKYVIIAAGKQIENKERFEGKRVYETKVSAPIKSSKEVFAKAKVEAKKLGATRRGTAGKAMSTVGGAKPMQALMAGVSYMIPFVVVGGILLAIALGIGGTPTQKGMVVKEHTFWHTILDIGGDAFALMIPILGGFIASAIAGRAAIAPAMIMSFVVGNSDGQLWNWQNMQFGGFSQPAQLGFLGAIAVGFFVGYLIKGWNSVISPKMPKALKPVEPIIIIPLLMTIVTWAFFSFMGYLPLFYISYGIKSGITELTNRNLFFIAAIIIGAMIAFDMGGPVNKIAFLISAGLIEEGKPEVMGAAAAAIAIPPLGSGLGVLTAKLFGNKNKFGEQDRGEAMSAIFMSMVGITEGAIPFAVKFPKQAVIANVIGSSVGAGVAAIFQITDNAAHGGPIVFLVGAIGKNGVTNYVWGLFFLMSILIGSVITAIIFNLLFKVGNKNSNKKELIKVKK